MVRSWLVDRAPRLWALWAASRPSQIALIVLLYGLGMGMATAGPPVVAGGATVDTLADVVTTVFSTRVVTGGVALLAASVAVHYANEYADTDTDALTDRTPFSGGSGALIVTGLPASFLRTPLVIACGVAVAVTLSGFAADLLPPAAVALLLAILGAGLAYSLPPVALVRRGVGEPINMVLGGLLVPVYGATVVGMPTALAALAVVPFTLLVGCNLLAVHWPDRRADETVGKRTLAVRWSPTRLRQAYAALAALAAVSTAGLWLADVYPEPVALAHLAPVPFLVWGWITLTRRRSPLPAVAAMVALAVTGTVAWWWVGLA